ncbi:spore germination protein [Cohnella hashimotonis]|uniref:Spore germination protein n=1 Tax=Cohnella hashimotonis TaxID=2826895 RepID=A0ABT6TEB6_9BACL|nr:spore germination protein [Cohnella hashimotonis]MDI4645178.1 spore germination protein [Cohnella hashimotonis]
MPSQLPPPPLAEKLDELAVSRRISDNLAIVHRLFANCGDLKVLPWQFGTGLENGACSIFLDTLVNHRRHNDFKDALQNLTTTRIGPAESVHLEQIVDFFENHGTSEPAAELIDTVDQVVSKMLDGCIVVLIDGWNRALGFQALDIVKRQVSEPITEPNVQGPHASTIEDLDSNIGVIRNLLKTSRLKFHFFDTGENSRRRVAYGYLDHAVKPATLDEFRARLEGIDTEEILDVSYLESWINNKRLSPFPQVRYTERPDTAVAALLEGKIVALINGSPSVLISPANFMEFFVASEDYYYGIVYSTLIRFLRLSAFIIALILPSTYIALTTFHSELIPTVLLLAILNTREGIPFPAMVEALLMEFFFELLREAGIRLPRPIGSAVSIVGALVIGQAAIQSQIASPVMVIVVALTGIASFALPQYNMAIALRILRFPLMFLAASFGGLGIMVGFLLIYLHLNCLRSLGEPYLSPIAPLNARRLRDALFVPSRRHARQSSQKRSADGQRP